MKKLLARYGAIGSQDRSAGVQVIDIQKSIRLKDYFMIKFGEPRGERYIDVLIFQRVYFVWVNSEDSKM